MVRYGATLPRLPPPTESLQCLEELSDVPLRKQPVPSVPAWSGQQGGLIIVGNTHRSGGKPGS